MTEFAINTKLFNVEFKKKELQKVFMMLHDVTIEFGICKCNLRE